MRLRLLLLACVSAALFLTGASAQDDTAASPLIQDSSNEETIELLGQLVAASSDDFETIIDEIEAQISSTKEIASLLEIVTPTIGEERTKNLKQGWTVWKATDETGTERPYQLYLPKSVMDGKAPQAMIVHMHGAVNRPEFGGGIGTPQAVGYGDMLWKSVADVENFVIVCPQGRTECSWWTDNGVSHVRAVIRDVRRSINVPDQSIFGAGFSDGASGCYYLAMVAPDPFAGFIAFNGHPAVASGASNKQVYLQNMSATPIFAGMTQEDSLYPSRNVLPHLTKAIANGANIHIVSYPKINHQPLYFTDQANAIVNFIKNTKRESGDEIRWLTAETKTGQAKWLDLLEFGECDNDGEPLPDVNVDSTPGRIRLGVELNTTDTGQPLINRVMEDSTAAKIGLKTNDIFVKFDGKAIEKQTDLLQAIRQLKRGESFSVSVERKKEVVDFEGQIPEFKPQPVYWRKGGPTSFANVRLNENSISVASHRVKKMRIWLPDGWSDKTEVKLELNGVERSAKVQTLSAKELLTSFAHTGDRFGNRFVFVVVEN